MNPTPTVPVRTLTELDHLRLTRLLERHPAAAPALAEVLEHADLLPSPQIAPDTVTMNSCVRVADPRTGAERQLTLCYPAEADPATGRLSVLSPAGAGLLGLRAGQRAAWCGPDGQPLAVDLRAIVYQPEASGDLLR